MKITFCINTSRNEKAYIELLMTSLLNGTDVKLHDYIVFVDSDNQETTELLLANKCDFPNLTIIKNNGDPVGYAGNINYMFSKAKHEIVSLLQSDMVVCLDYDKKVLTHLADNQILCSTRCEPPLHSQFDNPVTFGRNFGVIPDEFQYEDYLKFSEANKNTTKLTDYFFAPFTLYKRLWNDIGGHDVSFKKSREDSDIALRLALNKVEFKQCWDAMVYHFTCTSSRGIQWWAAENQAKEVVRQQNDRIEMERFLKKWGVFIHPTSPSEVERFVATRPEWLTKIKVTNPPIDETKLTFL